MFLAENFRPEKCSAESFAIENKISTSEYRTLTQRILLEGAHHDDIRLVDYIPIPYLKSDVSPDVLSKYLQ